MGELKERPEMTHIESNDENIFWVDKYISGIGNSKVYESSKLKELELFEIIKNRIGDSGIIEVAKTDLDTLISDSELKSGATYKITGVHKAHSVDGLPIPALYDDGNDLGTTIYLTALSETELSNVGYGVFYNPKYLKGTPGYGIFNNSIYVTLDNISGDFQFFNENVTADNGATAKIISKSKLEYISGDWANATSITGDNSGASADIMSVTVPSYNANDVVFWGGYAWQNLNGNVGVPTDVLNLDNEWEKLPYTDDDYYVKVLDRVEYDIKTDFILARYEVETNSFVRNSVVECLNCFFEWGVLPIPLLQWGMSLDIGAIFLGNSSTNNILSINSKGFMNNVSLDNNGRMNNVSIDNEGKMNNVSLDNNGRMTNVSLDNNGWMNNISLDNNGQMDNISLNNGRMNNISLNNGQMNNVSFESFIANFQNIVYSGKTFENITFTGKRGVTYNIPDLNSSTTIFDSVNCLHKEVFDAGGGVLNIRYWDVLANEFAIVNITN